MPANTFGACWVGAAGCGRGVDAYRDRIDCFRSGRDCPLAPPAPVVLAGRGGAAAASPKKSSPRSESLVLVVFGGAGSPFAAILDTGGPAVLDRWGMGSPPMRSGGGAATLAGWDDCPRDAFRTDSFRSMVCFSLTRLKGISSSPSASRVLGSGIGPSMTQRLSSYFVLIKFSILASDGAWPAANLASQYLLALEFPQLRTLWSCSSVQESRSTDLTRLMWVPMPRWMPEHRMQTKTPRFQLAHRGSEEERSQHSVTHLATRADQHTLVPFAIGAYFVGLQFQQVLDRGLVLCRPFGSGVWRPSRHRVCGMEVPGTLRVGGSSISPASKGRESSGQSRGIEGVASRRIIVCLDLINGCDEPGVLPDVQATLERDEAAWLGLAA
jgi:hypothetical protein